VKILRGTESDIIADGHLDYPDRSSKNLMSSLPASTRVQDGFSKDDEANRYGHAPTGIQDLGARAGSETTAAAPL